MLTPIILVADHQTLFVEGLSRLLQDKIDRESIATASNLNELLNNLERHSPEVIFLNYFFVENHFDLIRPILAKKGYPEIVVICDQCNDDSSRKAASIGALGVLSKDSSITEIWQFINFKNQKNETGSNIKGFRLNERSSKMSALTSRQRKILELLTCGMTNREISTAVGCAETTVKAHLNIAYKVLGVKNRTQAMYVISRENPVSRIA